MEEFRLRDYWRRLLLPYLLEPEVLRVDIVEDIKSLKGMGRLWYNLSKMFCDGVSEIDMAVAIEAYFDTKRGSQFKDFTMPPENLVAAPTLAAHYVAVCRQADVVPDFRPFEWRFTLRSKKIAG